jgi:hypothetical protein
MTTKEQHIEDTKYLTWADGMYVMLSELHDDYELAAVEDSLRDSEFVVGSTLLKQNKNSLAVFDGRAGYFGAPCFSLKTKLTRAQALYISTGQTCF